jgi:hypothetical protein
LLRVRFPLIALFIHWKKIGSEKKCIGHKSWNQKNTHKDTKTEQNSTHNNSHRKSLEVQRSSHGLSLSYEKTVVREEGTSVLTPSATIVVREEGTSFFDAF